MSRLPLFLASAALLLLLFAYLPYYPVSFQPLIGLAFVGFYLFALFLPLPAIAIWFAAAFLAGNHPGGRFMELYDFALLIVVVATLAPAWRSRLHAAPIEPRLALILSAAVTIAALSIAANPHLLIEWRNYTINPYFIAVAPEQSPLYPLRSLIALATTVYLIWQLDLYRRRWPNAPLATVTLAISIAVIATAALAIAEWRSPQLYNLLESLRLWLTGTSDGAPKHEILPGVDLLGERQPVKALFWNRSWLAVTLTATLPFLWLGYWQLFSKRHAALRTTAAATLIALYTLLALLIAARGFALALFAAAATALLLVLLRRLIAPTILQRLWPLAVVAVVAVVILVPLLITISQLDSHTSWHERSGHFYAAWQIYSHYPLLGGGFESFGWYRETLLPLLDRQPPAHHTAHNQLLQSLAGSGIPGALLYLALISAIVVLPMQRYWRDANREALILSAGSVAVVLYATVQEWNYLRGPAALFWLQLSLALSLADSRAGNLAGSGWNRLIEYVGSIVLRHRIAAAAIVLLTLLLAWGIGARQPMLHGTYRETRIEPPEVWFLGRGERIWPLNYFGYCPNKRIDIETDLSRFDMRAEGEYLIVECHHCLSRAAVEHGDPDNRCLCGGIELQRCSD